GRHRRVQEVTHGALPPGALTGVGADAFPLPRSLRPPRFSSCRSPRDGVAWAWLRRGGRRHRPGAPTRPTATDPQPGSRPILSRGRDVTMAEDSFLARRDFVRAGAAGAALLLGNTLPAWGEDAGLPRRVLGKTGVKVPILGLGTVAVGNLTDRKKAAA